MTQQREVTPSERQEFLTFWAKQRQAVQERLSEKTMKWFSIYTSRDNIGYEFGQLRPGEMGKWDLYSWLTDPEIGCDENDALIVSGLTAQEIAEEERRENLRRNYADPDNPAEVYQFERIQRMNPEELEAEISKLEGLLAT